MARSPALVRARATAALLGMLSAVALLAGASDGSQAKLGLPPNLVSTAAPLPLPDPLPSSVLRGVEVWPLPALTNINDSLAQETVLSSWNANMQSLSVFLVQENTTSSEVYITSDYSLTYDNVRDYIRRGKALGVGTMIRLFNAVEDMSDITQHIFPDDPQTWFETYTREALAYARVAEEEGAVAFCLASELPFMVTHPDFYVFWANMAFSIRAEFTGPITYCALPTISGQAFWKDVTFYDHLDWIGIDAYFSLANASEPMPPLEVVEERWAAILLDIEQWRAESNLTDTPVVFTEVGYLSTVDCLITPYAYPPPASVGGKCTGQFAPSNACQTLGLTALFNALPAADWIAGVFIQWLDQPGWDDFYPDGTLWPCFYTPRGKPGADVIAAAFAQPPRGP